MEVNRMTCAFRPTNHAKDRMIERGISRGEAVETITRGAKLRRGSKVLSRLRGIEIVYRPKKCHYHVITLYRR
jgi:hypothetical protein